MHDYDPSVPGFPPCLSYSGLDSSVIMVPSAVCRFDDWLPGGDDDGRDDGFSYRVKAKDGSFARAFPLTLQLKIKAYGEGPLL